MRHLQAAGGLPDVDALAERALAAAAEQTVAVPAERMTARLIRELAAEALASRTRLIEIDRELEALLDRHPDAASSAACPAWGPSSPRSLSPRQAISPASAPPTPSPRRPAWRLSGRPRFLRRPNGGNKGLKRVFYQSAFCSLGHDDSRTFYDGKKREGKHHHQAVIALARRRVNVLWAVLQNRTPSR